jgi:hypothetical protein
MARESVSIMEPLRRRKRAISAPGAHNKVARTGSAPNPWAVLGPLGDRATRTATALAELAIMTSHNPDTWALQDAIAEAVLHEILKDGQNHWKHGIEHGQWLNAQELEQSRVELHHLTSVEAKLKDLQLRHEVLQTQYDEAKSVIAASSLRDISNLVMN